MYFKFREANGDVLLSPITGTIKLEAEQQDEFASQVYGTTYKVVRSYIMIDGVRFTSSCPNFAVAAFELIEAAMVEGKNVVDLTTIQGEWELIEID